MTAGRSDPVPVFGDLAACIRHYAETTPDIEASVCPSQRLTYAELLDEVNRCAAALRAAGITSGDRVATLSLPNTNFLITFLATVSLDAIWLGLNPKHTRRELEYVLGDAEPAVVFFQRHIGGRDYRADFESINLELRAKLIQFESASSEDEVQPYGEFVADRESEIPQPVTSSAAAERPSLLVYTSGTTGKPKGALISESALISAARKRIEAWGHDELRILMNLPISHIGGAGDITCTALVAGGTLVFMERFDARETATKIQAERISSLFQVPTQLQLILDEATAANVDLTGLKSVCWSGARASDALIDLLAERFPGKLGSDYSMTESVGPITIVPLTGDLEVLKGSIGWPADELEVTLDEDSSEILVRGDGLMLGYLNRPGATRDAIDASGWLHTGDVGRFNEDGTLALVGRTKEMFVSGGYNVYPAEVEGVLESHPDVAFAAVVPQKDELWGEVGCAFVQPLEKTRIEPGVLREFCRSQLANYKVPKSFRIETRLPLLAIGKIDRSGLRRRLNDETPVQAE